MKTDQKKKKNTHESRQQETGRSWTEKTEQYSSKQECIK